MRWKVMGVVVWLTLWPGVGIGWGQTEALEEAKQLDQQVLHLTEQGAYGEAARLGERALAITEKALARIIHEGREGGWKLHRMTTKEARL